MSKVILTRIDSPEENEVNLLTGEVSIGRGSILGCDDKRISRKHGTLNVLDDGSVTLVSMHSNPCFYKPQDLDAYAVLTKGQSKLLRPGDEFSLLPNLFRYRVGLAKTEVSDAKPLPQTDIENVTPDPVQNTPPSKRRRVLPEWLTDLSPTVSSASTPTTPATCRKRKVSEVEVKVEVKEEPLDVEDRVGPCDTGPMDQVEPESAGLTDRATPGSAVPSDQAESESDGITDQATPGSAGPVVQTEPESSGRAKDGYEDEYGDSGRSRRETCVYGATCYRKNPQHREEFSHPGDSDYEVDPILPECPYGTSCYRKNLQHRKDYTHTRPPAPTAGPSPTTSNVASCNITFSVCPKCRNTTCVDLTEDDKP